MKIRKFKPKDAKAVSKIMIEAFRSFLRDKMDKWALKSFSPKKLKEISNSKKGHDSETISYVAEEKSEVMGYIRGSVSKRGLGTLDVIGVSPDCLHKGVGTELMKELEKFWRKKNTRKVSTCVSAHNTRALVFYIKSGFVPEGYQKDHFIVGIDEIVLGKFLQ